MSESLAVNILVNASDTDVFDKTSTPLIVEAFQAKGHEVTLVPADAPPEPAELLDCDVFIDRSPITDTAFFRDLAFAYFKKRSEQKTMGPVMVDNPFATMASFDKRKTHALMPDLVPESYNLDGVTNRESIGKFESDEYVVIKDPLGWYSQGMDRLSPSEAVEKYHAAKDLVVQKYTPFSKGVERIITMNYGGNFKVACAYLMIPDSWRTGEGVTVRYELIEPSSELEEFAQTVSRRSGLYLNGIDCVEHEDGGRVLFEVNAVPNLRVPIYYLGVDAPGLFVEHVEKSATQIK
jgi:glutathione synthase/RimK-type ligase-like ATP-grasp enzyme